MFSFIWFENSAGNCSKSENVPSDWERPITPKFWVLAVPLCVNGYSVLSQRKKTLFLYLLPYWGASFTSLTIIKIFFTCSSHMKLPPASLYILLSLNKCILRLNAHSKISVWKIKAKIWLSEHVCFFLLLLRQMWLSSLRFVFWACHMYWSHQDFGSKPLVMTCSFCSDYKAFLCSNKVQDLCGSEIGTSSW